VGIPRSAYAEQEVMPTTSLPIALLPMLILSLLLGFGSAMAGGQTPAELFAAVEQAADNSSKLALLQAADADQQDWSVTDRGHYYLQLGMALDRAGQLQQAHDAFSRTVTLLSPLPPSADLLHGLLERSYMTYLQTNSAERYCPDRFEALRLARQLDERELLLEALVKAAFCYQDKPDQFSQGLALLDEALAIAEDSSLTEEWRGMIFNATSILYKRNHLHGKAYEYALKAYEHWRGTDDRQDMFNMQHNLVSESIAEADWERAAGHVRQLHELADRSPEFADFRFFAFYNEGLLAFSRNDFAAAIAALQQARALEHTTQEQYYVDANDIMLATALFRTGETDAARELAQAYLDRSTGGPPVPAHQDPAEVIVRYAGGDHAGAMQRMWQLLDREKQTLQTFVRTATLAHAAQYQQSLDRYEKQLLEQELALSELQLGHERENTRSAWLITIVALAGLLGLALLSFRLHRAKQLFQKHACTDHLTGISNRLHVLTQGETLLEKAKQSFQPFSLVLMDIDHFKQVNDRYGHDAGDSALRHVVEQIQSLLAVDQVLGRYGGEEFLLILPGCDATAAMERAEHIRQQVADTPIQLDGIRLQLTLSLGVAALVLGLEDLDELLKLADQALYAAKHEGRNRTVLAEMDAEEMRSMHEHVKTHQAYRAGGKESA